MTHEMDIWHDSFVKIKEQTKTIEMRLFDEKRSLISTGIKLYLIMYNKY